MKSNIVDRNTNVDLSFSDINLKRHLLTFSGRYEIGDPLNKWALTEFTKNYFIYLTGHGGDNYYKIRYKEILFTKHFSDNFHELFARGAVE